MRLQLSPIVADLWGSCGRVTVRRFRGRHYVMPRPKGNPNASFPTPPPPTPFDIILDNTDPEWEVEFGTWNLSTAGTDYWQTDWQQKDPAGLPGRSKFTFAVPKACTAQAYAWWPKDAGLHTVVAFYLDWTTGQETIVKDQSIQGGQWVMLSSGLVEPPSFVLHVQGIYLKSAAADGARLAEVP